VIALLPTSSGLQESARDLSDRQDRNRNTMRTGRSALRVRRQLGMEEEEQSRQKARMRKRRAVREARRWVDARPERLSAVAAMIYLISNEGIRRAAI